MHIMRVLYTYSKVHSTGTAFTTLHFICNLPNKLDCSITKLERLSCDKCSNLFGQFLSYKENEVL